MAGVGLRGTPGRDPRVDFPLLQMSKLRPVLPTARSPNSSVPGSILGAGDSAAVLLGAWVTMPGGDKHLEETQGGLGEIQRL